MKQLQNCVLYGLVFIDPKKFLNDKEAVVFDPIVQKALKVHLAGHLA